MARITWPIGSLLRSRSIVRQNGYLGPCVVKTDNTQELHVHEARRSSYTRAQLAHRRVVIELLKVSDDLKS